jgi:hypothetical protein
LRYDIEQIASLCQFLSVISLPTPGVGFRIAVT